MNARTDCHRPGAIIPAHYESRIGFALPSSCGGFPTPGFRWHCAYDKRPGKVTEFGFVPDGPLGKCDGSGLCCVTAFLAAGKAARFGRPGKCDVCGAHYVDGEAFVHSPSGEIVLMGHDCADKYGAMYDASETELARDRMRAALATAITRKQNAEARAAFLAAQPGLAEAFALGSADVGATRGAQILADLRAKHVQWITLSDKQVALALRLAEEIRNPAPVAAEPPKALAPVSDERLILTGTVVHTDRRESAFGMVTKMLFVVDTSAGQWKAWGTLPTGAAKGETITIKARVEVSAKDPSFAFLSRPTLYVAPVKKPRTTKAQRFRAKARRHFDRTGHAARYWGSAVRAQAMLQNSLASSWGRRNRFRADLAQVTP